MQFIDSTGLRLLAARSKGEHHRLSLLRGPQNVRRAFEIAGLDKLLPFSD